MIIQDHYAVFVSPYGLLTNSDLYIGPFQSVLWTTPVRETAVQLVDWFRTQPQADVFELFAQRPEIDAAGLQYYDFHTHRYPPGLLTVKQRQQIARKRHDPDYRVRKMTKIFDGAIARVRQTVVIARRALSQRYGFSFDRYWELRERLRKEPETGTLAVAYGLDRTWSRSTMRVDPDNTLRVAISGHLLPAAFRDVVRFSVFDWLDLQTITI